MAKPTDLPRWADDGGDITEPLEGKKDIGYEDAELPSHSELNWLLNLIYQWTAYLDGLTAEALTWTNAHVFQKGLTVTQSTANTRAVIGTGNGTAGGVEGVGGSGGGANAWGIKGTGGGGNSEGVVGVGTGAGGGVKGTGGSSSGSGVSGIGGGPNGVGVWGDGTGTGSGVKGVGSSTAGSKGVVGIGGSTSGTGVEGTGGGGNSAGVKGIGSGAAGGVEGVGGGSSGTGVSGTGGASNGVGVWGDGTGSGNGVKGIGGATDFSAGVYGSSAATNGHGGHFIATGTGSGVVLSASALDRFAANILTGQIKFGGLAGNVYPDPDDARTNAITPLNIDKAWAIFTFNNSTSDRVSEGFNVTSVTQEIAGGANGRVTVTFASAMADTNYLIEVHSQDGAYSYTVSNKSTTGFQFRPYEAATVTYPDAVGLNGATWGFTIKGRN